jgi:hypothetical protein
MINVPSSMCNIMANLSQILSESAPKAWIDFTAYAQKFNPYTSTNDFNSIPFEMQLGIYLGYLQENNVEIDLINPDIQVLESTIKEAFVNFEKVIGHYS